MIPILFENSANTFTTNGLGRLADATRVVVTEERNGIYELEMDYPVTGSMFSQITVGRIIVCTHDEEGDLQPFDIYEVSEPIDGIATFYAHHISYRLNEVVVAPFTATTCANAIAGLKTNSIGTNPFTFTTDKTVTADYAVTVPSTLRGLLGGQEGSILDVYGTGEYKFDNFSASLLTNRGSDTSVSIRYGKNLIEFENNLDHSEVYNAVVPYWLGSEYDSETGENTPILVTLPEQYITANHTLPSGRTVIIPLDLSSEFETQPTVAQLRTLATSRLNDSDGWLPSQNITVNFVQLWQTDEYASLAPLQKVKLCDTVLVSVPMYNVRDLRIKVIKVVWNALLDRYDEMELGTPSATFATIITGEVDNRFDSTQQELNQLIGQLEGQLDAKIETWTQSTNPAANWTTQDARDLHNGDLWLYTGTSTITVGGVTIHPQGVYQYNSASNTWAAYSSTSSNLFDLVDGKTTIFYGTNTGTYANVQVGDYLVDSTNGKTYRWNGSAWVLLIDYKNYTDTAVGNAKVVRTEIQYCLSDSNASFVAYGSWSTTLPEYVAGKYYWIRTVEYYGDGTNNASTTVPRLYQTGQTAVETQIALDSTNNHFWYDNTGAYVTEDDDTYSTGYATRITNAGILQSYNGNLMSSWTNSGINFYTNDGETTLASFGAGGVILGDMSGYYTDIRDSYYKISSGADEILNINATGVSKTESISNKILPYKSYSSSESFSGTRSTEVTMAYGTTYTLKVNNGNSFSVYSAGAESSLPSSSTVTVSSCTTTFTFSRLDNSYYLMNVKQQLSLSGYTFYEVTREYTRTFYVPVLDFAGDIRAEGEIIGQTTSYTITTLSSGWQVYQSAADSAVTVRKNGKVVTLTGALSNTSSVTLNTTGVTVFNLPDGYAPPQKINIICQGSNTNIFLIVINTSGAVGFERYRNMGSTSYPSISSGAWFPFHVTWIME